MRKDYLLYAILIAVTCLLHSASNDILKKSVAGLLVIFALMIHEAFLFWGFTLFAIILLTDKCHRTLNFTLISISLIATAAITIFKGTTNVSQDIISSWNSTLPNQPLIYIGNSITALGWDTLQTFKTHFMLNVSPQTGFGGVILIPLMLIIAYYLFTNYMLYYSHGSEKERTARRTEISLLYSLFTVTLIPMLTVLSCDTGRVFQYITITTFCAFLILPQQRVTEMFPRWYKSIIQRFNIWIDRNFPPTKTSLLLILLTFAVNDAHFNLNASWSESVIGSLILHCRRILVHIS